MRLEDLLGDTDANRERILLEADSKARWPDDIGVGLFDIATICLNQKAKERPDMDQVRVGRFNRHYGHRDVGLGAGVWMLGVGCWGLGAGGWELRVGSWGLDAGGLGADGWVLGLNQVTHALLQKVHVSTYVGGFRNLYSRLGLCNEAYLLYMPHWAVCDI